MFKNKGLIPVLIFCFLLLSPLINTGLSLKQYTRFNEVLVIIAALFIFMAGVAKQQIGGLKMVDRWLALLGVWSVGSILWGYLYLNVIFSWQDFYLILNIFLFALYFRAGTYFTAESAQNRFYWKIIGLAIIVLNLLSISQLFPWGFKHVLPLYTPARYMALLSVTFEYVGTIGRIQGIIGSPTSFSIIMVILISMITSWLIFKPGKNHMIVFVFMLSITTLILTFSRSGALAFIVSQLFLFCVAWKKHRSALKKLFLVYLLMVIISVFYLTIIEKTFHFSGLRGFRLGLLWGQSYQGRGDVGNRVFLWMKGIDKGMLSPVFGWGPANSSNKVATKKFLENTETEFYAPHNEFINIFMQTGLIGLLLFLILFVRIYLKASALSKDQEDSHILFMARGIQAVIISLVVFDFFDGFWFNSITPAILMMMIGSMYALDKNEMVKA